MGLVLGNKNALSIKLVRLLKNLFSLMRAVLLDFIMFYLLCQVCARHLKRCSNMLR